MWNLAYNVRHPVVVTNSSLLTITLHYSDRRALVYTETKYLAPFMTAGSVLQTRNLCLHEKPTFRKRFVLFRTRIDLTCFREHWMLPMFCFCCWCANLDISFSKMVGPRNGLPRNLGSIPRKSKTISFSPPPCPTQSPT
jgi:hypothetical protein